MYTLGAITVGAHVFDQLDNVALSPGLTPFVAGIGGSVDAQFAANMGQDLRLRFTTTQIELALDKITQVADTPKLDGLPIVATTGANPVVLWWRQLDAGGMYTGGAVDVKATVARGILIPTEIDAGLDSPATAAYELVMLSDGVNVPVVIEKEQSYTPTHSGTGDYWGLGSTWIDGTLVAALQRFKLSAGLKVEAIRTGGCVWPTQASIVERRPMVEIETLDASVVDAVDAADLSFGVAGVALPTGIGNTRFHLQKLADGGSMVPIATTSHVRFTVTEGMVHVGDVSPTADNTPISVTITPTHDDTNEAVQIATGVAIAVS